MLRLGISSSMVYVYKYYWSPFSSAFWWRRNSSYSINCSLNWMIRIDPSVTIITTTYLINDPYTIRTAHATTILCFRFNGFCQWFLGLLCPFLELIISVNRQWRSLLTDSLLHFFYYFSFFSWPFHAQILKSHPFRCSTIAQAGDDDDQHGVAIAGALAKKKVSIRPEGVSKKETTIAWGTVCWIDCEESCAIVAIYVACFCIANN